VLKTAARYDALHTFAGEKEKGKKSTMGMGWPMVKTTAMEAEPFPPQIRPRRSQLNSKNSRQIPGRPAKTWRQRAPPPAWAWARAAPEGGSNGHSFLAYPSQ